MIPIKLFSQKKNFFHNLKSAKRLYSLNFAIFTVLQPERQAVVTIGPRECTGVPHGQKKGHAG